MSPATPPRAVIRRWLALTAVGAGLAIATTGCTWGSGSGYAVLDREAMPDDALPDGLPAYAFEELDPESARYVGEHDGARLYLSQGRMTGTICLLVYLSEGVDWFTGCGGGGGRLGVSGSSGSYEVRPDGTPVPDGAVAISPNVSVAG